MTEYIILYNNSDHTVTVPWTVASQVLKVLDKGNKTSKSFKDGENRYYVEVDHILALIPSVESDNKSIRCKIEAKLHEIENRLKTLQQSPGYGMNSPGLGEELRYLKAIRDNAKSWLGKEEK